MIEQQAVLAIIPARGGSVRVPGKNLRTLWGRPLVCHTIQHCLECCHVDRVVVSTDSDEIDAVARGCGAQVIRRPPEISGDLATSEEALLHAIRVLRERDGFQADLVAFLQCTAPVRFPGDLDRAIEQLIAEDCDSLLSVVTFRRFTWALAADGARPVNYQLERRPRSQELQPLYIENGSLYVSRRELLERSRNRLSGRISLFVMREECGQDIDTETDFVECERVMRTLPDIGRQ